MSEAQKNVKLKCLRIDRGGEFNSFEFSKFCEDNGIRRHLMAIDYPQENGAAEKRNPKIVSMMCSDNMLFMHVIM